MKNIVWKKVTSFVLALLMFVSVVPIGQVTAYADSKTGKVTFGSSDTVSFTTYSSKGAGGWDDMYNLAKTTTDDIETIGHIKLTNSGNVHAKNGYILLRDKDYNVSYHEFGVTVMNDHNIILMSPGSSNNFTSNPKDFIALISHNKTLRHVFGINAVDIVKMLSDNPDYIHAELTDDSGSYSHDYDFGIEAENGNAMFDGSILTDTSNYPVNNKYALEAYLALLKDNTIYNENDEKVTNVIGTFLLSKDSTDKDTYLTLDKILYNIGDRSSENTSYNEELSKYYLAYIDSNKSVVPVTISTKLGEMFEQLAGNVEVVNDTLKVKHTTSEPDLVRTEAFLNWMDKKSGGIITKAAETETNAGTVGSMNADAVWKQALNKEPGAYANIWMYMINRFFTTGESFIEETSTNGEGQKWASEWKGTAGISNPKRDDYIQSSGSIKRPENPELYLYLQDYGTALVQPTNDEGVFDQSAYKPFLNKSKYEVEGGINVIGNTTLERYLGFLTAEEDLRIRIYYNILRSYMYRGGLKEDIQESINAQLPVLDKIFSMDYSYINLSGLATTEETGENTEPEENTENEESNTEGGGNRFLDSFTGIADAIDPEWRSKVQNIAGKFNTSSADAPIIDFNYSTQGNDRFIFSPFQYEVAGGNASGQLMSNAERASKNFNGSGENASATTVVYNFSNIVDYYLYGAVEKTSSYKTKEDSTTNGIDMNDGLTNMVPEFNWTIDDTKAVGEDSSSVMPKALLQYSQTGLPLLEGVPYVANTQMAHKFYGKIYLSLMYVKRWCAVETEIVEADNSLVYKVGAKGNSSGLSFVGTEDMLASAVNSDNDGKYNKATDKQFKNEKLEEFINNNKDKNIDDVSVEGDIANIIRAYTQIHDGMKALGLTESSVAWDDSNDAMRSWITPEMKAIYGYYDDIKDYVDKLPVDTYQTDGAEGNPFEKIFNDNSKQFSTHYVQGVAASSTYIPLVTNIYSPESFAMISDFDAFVKEFHYKYGFLRKALYKDTQANAAMSTYVSDTIGKLGVVTLRDLIENDGSDIVLYIDTNLYNVDVIAEKQNLAYSRIINSADAGTNPDGAIDSIGDWFADVMDVSAESICKTGPSKLYSNSLVDSVDYYGKKVGEFRWPWDNKNHYLFGDESIKNYINSDNNDSNQQFAVVSGIYRDKSVFNIAQNQSANPKPVFVSSKSLATMNGVTKEEFNSIYNYMIVSNLSSKQDMSYTVDIDLDSPLFMDVYGNIVTMSGLVVIPAASNATLFDADSFDPATAGLASVYNQPDSKRISARSFNNSDKFGDLWKVDSKTEEWVMGTTTYGGGGAGTVIMNFANLPISSSFVKDKMYNKTLSAMSSSAGDSNSAMSTAKYNQRVNIILEVLRGAVVENIDLVKEGLEGNTKVDKTGIYVAYRVEQLGKLLNSGSNGNSLLQLPNLAYMPGMELITTILFQLLFCVMFYVLAKRGYQDAMTEQLGLKTIGSFILTVTTIIGCVVGLPYIVNYTYYSINQTLLQDEAIYMEMLNLEKKNLGQEISLEDGAGGQPSSNTKFYLKLENIRVPWWQITTDVLAADTFTRMQDIYDEALKGSIYNTFGDKEGDIKQLGSALYADVDWLFSTSDVVFVSADNSSTNTQKGDATAGFLVQNVQESPSMSYVLPYYVIMDNLLEDIRTYNESYNITAYSVGGVQVDGSIGTKGLLRSYLTSNAFMNGDFDNLCGLYQAYGITPIMDRGLKFTEEQVDKMQRSLWCNYDLYDYEGTQDKLKELDYSARKFVADNYNMLDKVSDETFIKCMSLFLATKHNELFKVPACRGLEVFDIDSRDIMRLSLADKGTVMKNSQKTFELFCYDTGGLFCVILAAFLELIYWVVSLIKPITILVLMSALILSFIIKRVIQFKSNHSLEGYLVSVALICVVNILYALMINMSMAIPNYGASTVICLIVQILLQIVYAMCLVGVIVTVASNMQDVGFYFYKAFYDQHMSNKITAIQVRAESIMSNSIFGPLMPAVKRHRYHDSYSATKGLTGDDILVEMRQREERRQDDIYNNR